MERYFTLIFGGLQLVLLLLFVFCTTNGDEEDLDSQQQTQSEYMIFRDIMVMLLLGFGYLMAFLRHYGLGAVGFTLMLTALGVELNLLVEPLMKYAVDNHSQSFPIPLRLPSLIDGEFAAATLLISYGAVIGRATPLQLLVMAFFQAFFYAVNKVLVVFGSLQAEDVGGTITIHLFGAYFGLAASRALGGAKPWCAANNSSSRTSDLFSLIGTSLLWVYWPSFVGATETSDPVAENRCILHTVMALLGSTAATFFLSRVLLGGRHFHPVHVANSTLAGGVAIGASARLAVTPGGAFVLGVVVGLVSVFGYHRISPFLEDRISVSDTCGVHNLHGLPAILGGLASAVFVTLDSDSEFLQFNKGVQAAHQVYAVLATLALSLASGYLTGNIMSRVVQETPEEYIDAAWWKAEYLEEDVAFFPSDKSGRSLKSITPLDQAPPPPPPPPTAKGDSAV